MAKNNQEIEVKATFQDQQAVLNILQPQLTFVNRVSINDTYFSSGASMSNTNNLVRIREINNDKVELTFKGKTVDTNNIWQRTEITTLVDSATNAKAILANLGLKVVSEYQNAKEYYDYNGLEIVFARFTLPATLEFMEIEGDTTTAVAEVIEKLGQTSTVVGEEIFDVFDRARNNTAN